MKIIIPEDYQDAVRTLDCYSKLQGHEVIIFNDSVQDIETLAERFQEADALVLIRERTALPAELLERLPRLKIISQTGRGIPHIDLEACTRLGIAVAVGGGSSIATAELTWALILASQRNIPHEVTQMRLGKWQTTLGLSLHGRTLGILGYGNIGKMVAGYGKAFGMRVLAWGREGSLTRAHADGVEVASNQRDLFEQSDVLSIHLKLVENTRGKITEADLKAMKPNVLLVNTSRAELIAPNALVNVLQAGQPFRAAVDVYENEPLIDHPLLHLPNVICTPHLGYVEKDNYELYFGAAFDHLLAFWNGQPAGIVNPEVLS